MFDQVAFEEVPPGSFAFWRYDNFPYLIGAEITHQNARGHIKARGYEGYAFKPLHTCPTAEGQIIVNRLLALRIARSDELRQIDQKYQEQRDQVLAEFQIKD